MKTLKTIFAAPPLLALLLTACIGTVPTPDAGSDTHTVVPLNNLPQDGANLVFTTVPIDAFSAIRTRRNVAIRDTAAWTSLWDEHTANKTPVPVLPQVDFNTQMLVGIFGDDTKGRHEFEIRRVNLVGGKIVVDYEDRDINPNTICLFAITNPMHIVAIPRIEADVVFNQIVPTPINFNTIDRSSHSGVQEPMNVVVRDMASWSLVWTTHTGSGRPVPALDFSTTMVIGVFLGVRPNGCYSTEITDVYRVNSVINVSHIDTEPGEGAICTQAIVTPAHLFAIPRSDDPVVFSAERRKLKPH